MKSASATATAPVQIRRNHRHNRGNNFTDGLGAATLLSGATWAAAGHNGGALSLDGTDDYATFTSEDMAQVTFAAWVYFASPPASGNTTPRIVETPGLSFMAAFAGGTYNNCLRFHVFRTAGNRAWYTPTDSFLPDRWNHVTVTYNVGDHSAALVGTEVPKIYINGTLMTLTYLTQTESGNSLSNTGTGRIGASVTANRCWKGRIDDFRIYKRMLSDAEIAAIAQ